MRQTGRIVETGDYYVGEYRNVRLNSSTGELELRRSNYVSLEGISTRGADQGPKLENGRLVIRYTDKHVAEYTRYYVSLFDMKKDHREQNLWSFSVPAFSMPLPRWSRNLPYSLFAA